MNTTLTTREAATILGVSLRRVQQLIKRGQLPALRHGRDYLLQQDDVAQFAQKQRPAHRPRNEEE